MRIVLLLALAAMAPVLMGSAGRVMELPEHWLAEFRDTTCEYETRGKTAADRIDAIGGAKEAGYCQVKKTSAKDAGFITTNRELLTKDINFAASLAVLNFCATKHKTQSLHRVAYCYNGGPWARYRSYKSSAWGYANEVKRLHDWRMANGND